MNRRYFLLTTAAAMAHGGASLSKTERVRRALAGRDLDRPPFSFWHHFGLKTPEAHASATLNFHRDYRTDIVKVMSDFPYPKPAGNWWELKPEANPFAPQIRALELIRDGLKGEAPIIETLFNPWNVAEKLSSKQEVLRLMREKPQTLLDALEVITTSEINHVKRALEAGGLAGLVMASADAAIPSPSFSNRTVSTQVTMEDGDTIAIGGIISESHTYSSSGIPVLHRIPVLGYAFGNKTISTKRTELLIFMTPHVIHDMNHVRDASEELKSGFKKLKNLMPE